MRDAPICIWIVCRNKGKIKKKKKERRRWSSEQAFIRVCVQGAFLPGLCEVEFEPGTLAWTEAMSTEAMSTDAMSSGGDFQPRLPAPTSSPDFKPRLPAPTSRGDVELRIAPRRQPPPRALGAYGPRLARVTGYGLRRCETCNRCGSLVWEHKRMYKHWVRL